MILAALSPEIAVLPPQAKRKLPLAEFRSSSYYFIQSSPRHGSSFRCFCRENETVAADEANPVAEGFSVLSPDIPWDRGSVWSTLAMYMFSLHIPLGIGGLSIAAYLLRQPALDPETQAVSLLVVQILELAGALLLLGSAARPDHKLINFFQVNKSDKERNWVLGSALGFGFLLLLILLTSLPTNISSDGYKAANSPMVKEILESSNTAKAACALIYCITTPLLEETVYRGFLLRCLASRSNWQQAVLLSSAVFSAAHFSGENFMQLFIVGCVLGCCYCWTGRLSSSIAVHAMYNAMILLATFV